jgi:hypothetical protein
VAYLSDRLAEAGQPHLIDTAAADLAEQLGHLPLALAHAAAFMANQEESCHARQAQELPPRRVLRRQRAVSRTTA